MGQTKEIYLVIRGQRWTNQWKILAFYNRKKAMKYAWKKAKKELEVNQHGRKYFKEAKEQLETKGIIFNGETYIQVSPIIPTP